MIFAITGLFKTLLILIGAFFLLRFIGQFMNAKRNMEEERELSRRDRKFQNERNDKLKNFGKTKIVQNKNQYRDVKDVDYEEVD